MRYVWLLIACFVLVACGPSAEQISASQTSAAETVFADLTAQAPTNTPSATSTNLPTSTFTPTITPTPTPRPTRTPSPTPPLGDIHNPAGIGNEFNLSSPSLSKYKMSAKLLEVQRGDEAHDIAKREMDWIAYEKPIEGQEYLAVKVKLAILESNSNDVETIYPGWHLTLRYEFDGSDLWSAWPVYDWDFTEGYVPIEGEGWVIFRIREDSQPYLYFQPYLMVTEQVGDRTSGVFFDLDKP